MTTDATDPDGAVLGPGAAAIVRRANDAAADSGDAALGVNHWLIAVVTRNAAMAEGLADGLAASALRPWLHERLRAGEAGARLDEATVVADARTLAARRGSATPNEADVVEVVLRAAGYTVHGKSGPVAGGPPTPPGGGPGMASGAAHGAASGATDGAAVAGGGGQESPSTPQGDSARPASDGGAGPATAPGGGAWTPRAKRPTPTLDAFGRDLTAEARAGRLPELIGREVELSVVVETLCRRTKRNPALVGPAGTGKTAIVEGLAARVVAGEVPALLRGFRIVQLSPSSLVAGAGVYGVLDERMKAVLAEAAQDGIALFIDELHSIVGAGGARGSSDLASLLKPALARGDIACIAATTATLSSRSGASRWTTRCSAGSCASRAMRCPIAATRTRPWSSSSRSWPTPSRPAGRLPHPRTSTLLVGGSPACRPTWAGGSTTSRDASRRRISSPLPTWMP